MRKLTVLFLFLALFAATQAQEPPSLTSNALEDYKLGETPPAKSSLAGLTAKRIIKVENQEGEEYRIVYLKFYFQGRYLGKGRLNDGGKLDEIRIVSPEARHQAGYSVGTTWEEMARSFPGATLAYTYVSDRILFFSPYQDGIQIEMDKKDYIGRAKLTGEFQELKEEALKAGATIKSIRIFWVAEK